MEFRILGPLGVYDDGSEVPLGKPQERAVLAALLLHANEAVGRERLVDLVWGEAPPRTAAGALYNHVSRLRRSLGADRLESGDRGYLLRVDEGELDSERFEALVARGRKEDAASASELLREALALWRGEALADFRYEAFAQTDILRLEELRLVALEARIDADLELGRHEQVVAELESLIAAHPWRERFRAQLMLALYRGGRQAEALDAYRAARGELLAELGIEPGAELRELESGILRQEPTLDLGAPPTPLPTPVSALVGRESVVEEVDRLLARDDVRLLTLVGPGGVGKSRLAIDVASRSGRRAVFCDLSPLSSPDRVLPALAYALGVRDAAGDRLAEGAAARARDLEPLLVLDCFERVIEAGPAVAAVLAGAPGLTVLATSRRRLGLNGEFVYEVPPLDSECALSLFCERAQAVLSRFRLTERNRNPIEAICRRLDGLPLALELAAARIAVLAPAELLSRLERRRLALTGGARDLPERQRTLEAAIASSYELLDEASQQTFDRLGLFASPFTLTAAEAIAEASLDDVTRLVEMSLLVRADDGGDEARLHMLDTIRDFARERLERGAEADTLRGRHAAFFSHLYEDGHATVRDVEELRAAYAHARAHDERESALRLARGLAHLLGLGLELAEARRVLEEALSFARAETPIRGHALLTLANALLDQGEDPAQPEREAFAIFDRLGDHDHVALALGRRATRLAQRGKIKLAKVAADDCLARLDAVSAENGPMVTFVLAGAYAAIGDAPDIEARLEIEAVAAFRSRGDRVRLAMALNNFAIGAIDRGDFDAAGRALREAHAIAMEIGSVTTILGVEVNSGWYELVRGDPAAAELRFRNGFGDRDGTRAEPRRRLAAEILLGLAASAAAQGRLARAARLAGAARRTLSRTRQNRLAHLERRIEEHDLAAARSELGDAVFSRHYEEGQALRFDEAVAYALTE